MEAPTDLVEFRRDRFSGTDHDYWRRMALADCVPEATLKLSLTALSERIDREPGCWQELAGA